MKFYLAVLCLIHVITVVESLVLDIKPSTNVEAGSPTLTVKCQPSSVSASRIAIFRKLESVKTEQVLGTVQTGQQPTLGSGLTSPKYTLSGSLTSFLQIVIQEPNSGDKGSYGCNTTEFRFGASISSSRTVTVNVQGSGDMNAGCVVFFLSASFINLILYYL